MTNHTGQIAFKNHGGPRVIDCEACGYAHLDPLPTQEALDKLYRDEYYQSYHAGWFDKEAREQWYWRRVYRQRASYFTLLFGAPIGTMNYFVQDEGSGCGWFAKAVDEWRNFLVWSYEPSVAARAWGKVRLGLTINAYHPNTRFDFNHCSFVLEHVLDPLATLKDIHQRLVTDGVLCIVVPNERNPLQRKLAERYDYSPVHPHHVNYFDSGSLTALVKRAGFEIVRTTSTFPIEWFALHGLNYVRTPKLGLLAHWLRMAIEATALTVAPDRWERKKDCWAEKGWGREVELWVRKNRAAKHKYAGFRESDRVQVGGWGFPREIAEQIKGER